MAAVRLMAYRRAGSGSGAARRLRREGKLPATLSGHDTEEAIAVDATQLQDILQSEAGEHTLIDLFINADPPERCRVRLRAVQTDAVSLAPLHADFSRVSLDERDAVTWEERQQGCPQEARWRGERHVSEPEYRAKRT